MSIKGTESGPGEGLDNPAPLDFNPVVVLGAHWLHHIEKSKKFGRNGPFLLPVISTV